jgi:hypothetical protein
VCERRANNEYKCPGGAARGGAGGEREGGGGPTARAGAGASAAGPCFDRGQPFDHGQCAPRPASTLVNSDCSHLCPPGPFPFASLDALPSTPVSRAARLGPAASIRATLLVFARHHPGGGCTTPAAAAAQACTMAMPLNAVKAVQTAAGFV